LTCPFQPICSKSCNPAPLRVWPSFHFAFIIGSTRLLNIHLPVIPSILYSSFLLAFNTHFIEMTDFDLQFTDDNCITAKHFRRYF